jgi:hypothetical protein
MLIFYTRYGHYRRCKNSFFSFAYRRVTLIVLNGETVQVDTIQQAMEIVEH